MAAHKPKPKPAPKPEPKPAKYPEVVVKATKRANELRAPRTVKRIGGAQVSRVLAALNEQGAGELTAEQQVEKLSGASLKVLRRIAAGEGSAEEVAALRPLAATINDAYCRGSWLAAELVGLAEALKEAKP